MRHIFITVAMAALALAKPNPETYKEKEDFQYSRSSSDDGSKSGFYGAQRGNMGGNYERAHNMDILAQHQMSGLVNQVGGELGEGAKTRTGSVYTAASSRGIYGSGNYDLSNLKGRNFEEGESFGNSQSHSSLTSHNSGYRSHSYSGMNSAGVSSSNLAQDSRYRGYQSSGHADQTHTDNLQAVDMSQGHGRYETDNQAGYNMNYHTQYGSHGKSAFDQSSTNLHSSNGFGADSQSRFITTPVRVVLRPGGRVAIPISAPHYAVSQNVRSEDTSAINTEAEVLNQPTNYNPTNKVKHYESSYSYRKEWEKQHTQPAEGSIGIPTENPIPKNSELYDEAQLLQSAKNQFQNANLQTTLLSNINSQHRANTKTAASQHQSSFNSQQSQSGFNAQRNSASSDTYANAYGQNAQQSGTRAGLTNAVENVDLKPKSYHSSYSYHKSWERQGDPYVIKPVGGSYDGQTSQRLSASSNSGAYSSHQYGSHSRNAEMQSYLANHDCDDEGHVRVARSYNSEPELQQQNQYQWEDLGQQAQNRWDKLEYAGQQIPSKLEHLEDLGQHNKWDNLQDLGQQTQNQWDNLQQVGQESQNQWEDLQHLGQESQNQWDNLQQLGQQTQDKLEDVGQQIQNLEQSQNEKLEDFSQHENQNEEVLKNFEQQANAKEYTETQNAYAQQEHYANFNNWDQTTGFEQSNTQHLSQSLFGNTEYNNSGTHNNAQDVSWNFNNFWHTNEFNQFNKQFEDNFRLNNQSTSDTGTQLNSLWDKIDNIAGEYSIDGKTDENKNVNYMQNGYGWTDIPANPNFEIPQINRETVNDDQNLEHHNLFDDQLQSASTTVKPNKVSHVLPKSTGNSDSFNNTEKKTSADEGRGDIGPEEFEIPTEEKSYRTPAEIETLSLTKDTNDNKVEGTTIQPNPMHNKEENTGTTITVSNANNTQENSNQIRRHKIFSTFQRRVSTTTPSIQIGTTAVTNTRSIIKDNSVNERPTLNVLESNDNQFADQQKSQEQTEKTIETLEHIQQQNLEQQLENFGQQLQSSWTPIDNLEQEYIQQNMEQQFEDFHTLENVQPNQIPEEIGTLSLTKDTHELNSMKNKDEGTSIESSFKNLSNQATSNQNRQHKLFSNLQSEISTTSRTIQITTENHNISLPDPQAHQIQEPVAEILGTPEEIQQQNLDQQFEDFNQQLQSSWFPSDHLQQENDPQMEQQFENIQDQTSLQDFEQHVQSPLQSSKDIEQLATANNFEQKEHPSASSRDTIVNTQQLVEPERTGYTGLDINYDNEKINDNNKYLQSNQKIENSQLPPKSNLEAVSVPVDTSTENPGFWQSVGNKFSNAKNKVWSWFQQN